MAIILLAHSLFISNPFGGPLKLTVLDLKSSVQEIAGAQKL